MGTRRTHSREFKVEAVKLVTERGVAVVQAARDLEVVESVLRRWMRELAQDPRDAFPGKGVMKPEQAEMERLRKEVVRLKMERDILKKKPRPTLRGSRCEIRLHCEAPGNLAGGCDVRGARCLAQRVPCLVLPAPKPPQPGRRADRLSSSPELSGQRQDLWRPPCLA